MTKSDVRAVDHIGITVPDLDVAQKYFEDVLGAEYLYDVLLEGPVSGPGIEEALGLQEGTVLNSIRMMGLGKGPCLELFSYSAPEQRNPVRASDIGLQHFAVFVDDIDAVCGRVKKHGGKVLGHIDILPGNEAGPGNRYVYTHTPWGAIMELITIKSPQAFQKKLNIRRWQPEKS